MYVIYIYKQSACTLVDYYRHKHHSHSTFFVDAPTNPHTHTYTHTHIHARTHTHTHAHNRTHTYTLPHTSAYTHTHTFLCISVSSNFCQRDIPQAKHFQISLFSENDVTISKFTTYSNCVPKMLTFNLILKSCTQKKQLGADQVTKTPNGDHFVKPSVKKGNIQFICTKNYLHMYEYVYMYMYIYMYIYI